MFRGQRDTSVFCSLGSYSFDFTASPPSSLVSVPFAPSGSLLFRRDYQTSLSCPSTHPLNSTMPSFGSAWQTPRGSCTSLLCKKNPKLALHCSGRHLGNSKASERNSHCSPAVLIPWGMENLQKMLSPSPAQAAPLWHCHPCL